MPRVILLLTLLAGCAAPSPPPEGFRDPGAPIYSNAAFTPTRLEGSWRQAALFTPAARPGCPPGQATFAQGPRGLTLTAQLCLDGRVNRISGPVTPLGPGRFRLPGLGEAWVIWVDADTRTLALATPSGAWGLVLDKGSLPPDRLTAAADIFAFNGYRAGSLKPF